MKYWQEEQLKALRTINCANQEECEKGVFDTLLRETKQLGFEYCAYTFRSPFPLSRPETTSLNNYPTQWQQIYEEKNFIAVDPTIQHGVRSSLPLVWSDEIYSVDKDLRHAACLSGLRFGWTQSYRDASGITGIFTLARSHNSLTKKELHNKGLRMTWIAHMAHLGLSKCISCREPQTSPQLTQREILVLQWTADGKTSWEIAEIIGISERTVNFHINNATEKLNVTNRTAAAVKAALLGLVC